MSLHEEILVSTSQNVHRTCLGDDLLQPCRHILLIVDPAGRIRRLKWGNCRKCTGIGYSHQSMKVPVHDSFSAIPSALSQVSLKKLKHMYSWVLIIYWYYMCVSKRASFLFNFTILSWQTPNFIMKFQRHFDRSLDSNETKWRTSRWSLWIASQSPNAAQLKAIQTKKGVNTSVVKHPELQANLQLKKFQNLILWGEYDFVAWFVIWYNHHVFHILHQAQSLSIPSL